MQLRFLARRWGAFAAGLAVPAMLAFLAGGCRESPRHRGHSTVEVTDANFDQVTAKGVALVDFWATWCEPCLTQGPIVEEIAEKYAGRVFVGKLDVDKNVHTARRFEVKGLPTLIVFRNGREYRRLTGVQGSRQLAAVLDEALTSGR